MNETNKDLKTCHKTKKKWNINLKTCGKGKPDTEKELKKCLKTSDSNYDANKEFCKDVLKLVIN
jgi:hypothetical protein